MYASHIIAFHKSFCSFNLFGSCGEINTLLSEPNEMQTNFLNYNSFWFSAFLFVHISLYDLPSCHLPLRLFNAIVAVVFGAVKRPERSRRPFALKLASLSVCASTKCFCKLFRNGVNSNVMFKWNDVRSCNSIRCHDQMPFFYLLPRLPSSRVSRIQFTIRSSSTIECSLKCERVLGRKSCDLSVVTTRLYTDFGSAAAKR